MNNIEYLKLKVRGKIIKDLNVRREVVKEHIVYVGVRLTSKVTSIKT